MTKRSRPIPNQRGLFWARGERVGYFDLIVYIQGDPPFYRLDVWHIFERRIQKDANPDIIAEFGPEILDLSRLPPDQAWEYSDEFVAEDWRTE